jgi:hypothetical protein
MRKNNIILLISIVLIFFSCQSKIKLDSDKYLNDTFSKSEIKEIGKMISYVDNMVLSNVETKDINYAYHQFLDRLEKTIQDSSRFLVPFEEEEKYQFLESLDSTVYKEFWHMSNHVRMARYKDTIYKDLENYKNLSLSPVGRYKDYLEKVGENDEFFKSLEENIELLGDLPTGTAMWFPKNHHKFDFSILKNRLWVVVYILRIEEHHDKKMERYIKQKNSIHNNKM